MGKTTQLAGARENAARQLAETFTAETLDSLIKDAVKSGTPIDGADGLLNELTKAVLERALNSELAHHLGYESGDPTGRGSGNSRNGTTPKTVTTVNGPVDIRVPRDRNGSFEPAIVPKKTRRLNNINSVVLSLYSRGMTTRDIEAHLAEVYGAAVSRDLISNITEVVVDEIKAWQPLARRGLSDPLHRRFAAADRRERGHHHQGGLSGDRGGSGGPQTRPGSLDPRL